MTRDNRVWLGAILGLTLVTVALSGIAFKASRERAETRRRVDALEIRLIEIEARQK